MVVVPQKLFKVVFGVNTLHLYSCQDPENGIDKFL
jgi:hypothetical protein